MTESKEDENVARPSLKRFFSRQLPLQPDLKAHFIFWFLTIAGLILDLWSKRAVFDWLKSRDSVPVINGFLQLVIAENTGAAFGLAAGQQFFLRAVSVVALIVVILIFLFSETRQRLVYFALGLFAAGVCGNLYDRFFNDGRVRDFIDVVYWPGKHWPAFNLADTMLCIGVGLLIISSFRVHKSS